MNVAEVWRNVALPRETTACPSHRVLLYLGWFRGGGTPLFAVDNALSLAPCIRTTIFPPHGEANATNAASGLVRAAGACGGGCEMAGIVPQVLRLRSRTCPAVGQELCHGSLLSPGTTGTSGWSGEDGAQDDTT